MRLVRSLFVASVAFGLAACAGRPENLVPVTIDDLTTTHVLNRNPFPVTIYLTQAGLRHRLGVVESMSAEIFQVPPRLMSGPREFRLLAAPLGPHPSFASELFQLQPGQAASWRLGETRTRELAAMTTVSVQ